MKDEVILAIESSCDETAIAILKNGNELLVNSVDTQIEQHKKFGGVYPELASRLHLQNITKILKYSLSLKGFDLNSITHVAVTCGPGLPGALQIGVMAGKTIASYLNVPLVCVHHLAGHIYANEYVKEFDYPLIAVIASGGNSEIIYMEKPLSFKIIGETEDDAIGEAFDKVARALGLPYPGGVMIDKLTKGKDIKTVALPKVKMEGYNLSYSGLKSHLIRMIEKEKEKGELSDEYKECIAKSCEVAFVDQLLDKVTLALNDYKIKNLVIGGGVSANSYLRQKAETMYNNSGINLLIPPLWCTTDNAAMIAKVAHHKIMLNQLSGLDVSSNPSMDIQ